MGVKKIEYIPARKLSEETRKKYGLKDNEFAQIKVTNPGEGIEVKGVKSAIEEVKKYFNKKELKNFRL